MNPKPTAERMEKDSAQKLGAINRFGGSFGGNYKLVNHE